MEEISHKGKVVDMTPATTVVEIVSSSACSECHAKALCGLSENVTKTVEVPTSPLATYAPGDEVEVCLKATMGLKAVWVSYVIPLILLLAVLLSMNKAGLGELAAGLSGIGAVAVYYLVIYLLRNRLRNEYVFYIK
ncbi:MAG: SoxR reducing system RseC family protein [Bacteroidales bacterium]|nr:SoxR reducing system RseC family protein [Bacteroidales bacterium]